MAVLGAMLILGGLLCFGVGLADRRAKRRIRSSGEAAWALITPAPRNPDDSPSAYRPLLRFKTEDGREVEAFSPVGSNDSRPLIEGRKVLVHYDPSDPGRVVVHGSRPYADVFFIALGAVAVCAAIVALVLAP